jgi:AraC-like DNA-binding protein
MSSINIAAKGVNVVNEEKFSLRLLSQYTHQKALLEDSSNRNIFIILVIQKGSGNYTVDFSSHEIEDDQVIFISQGQKHGLSKESIIEKGWELRFSKSFLDENEVTNYFLTSINIYKTYGDRLPMTKNSQIFSSICQNIQNILDLSDQDLKLKERIYSCYLQLILINIHNLSRENTIEQNSYSNAAHKILINFRNLVEENFRGNHKVGFYSDKLSITPDHLNKTIKSLLDISAKDLIQTRILTEAKRMIVHTPISSKELSFVLGFKDPSHFSNFFKKWTKKTVLEFKRSHLY